MEDKISKILRKRLKELKKLKGIFESYIEENSYREESCQVSFRFETIMWQFENYLRLDFKYKEKIVKIDRLKNITLEITVKYIYDEEMKKFKKELKKCQNEYNKKILTENPFESTLQIPLSWMSQKGVFSEAFLDEDFDTGVWYIKFKDEYQKLEIWQALDALDIDKELIVKIDNIFKQLQENTEDKDLESKVTQAFSNIINQKINGITDEIQVNIEINAYNMTELKNLNEGMIYDEYEKFKEGINEISEFTEPELCAVYTPELFEQYKDSCFLQFSARIVEFDESTIKIKGIGKDGIIYFLYTLPEIAKAVKNKAFDSEMPEEWIQKEKFVNDLSYIKEFDYKSINPEKYDEICEKVKNDFPGYEAKSIKISQHYYAWKTYKKELRNCAKSDSPEDFMQYEKELYHLYQPGNNPKAGELTINWQGYRAFYFCDYKNSASMNFILPYLSKDKEGNCNLIISKVVIFDILDNVPDSDRRVAKVNSTDAHEYGCIKFTKNNTELYSIYKINKFYDYYMIKLSKIAN